MGNLVDGWRVEIFEPDRRLRLLTEMKLPGRAWLEFEGTATPRAQSFNKRRSLS